MLGGNHIKFTAFVPFERFAQLNIIEEYFESFLVFCNIGVHLNGVNHALMQPNLRMVEKIPDSSAQMPRTSFCDFGGSF